MAHPETTELVEGFVGVVLAGDPADAAPLVGDVWPFGLDEGHQLLVCHGSTLGRGVIESDRKGVPMEIFRFWSWA